MPRPTLPLALFLSLSTLAHADDRILTFGGGAGPTSNQVSLEKNVAFFRRVLDQTGLAHVSQNLFFADGGKGRHAVQFATDDSNDSDFRQTIDRILDQNGDWFLRYGTTTLTSIDGPNNAVSMNKWFDDNAQAMRPGDHFLFYFTGHGGDARRGDFAGNTTMSMWNNSAMPMRDFARNLDKLDPAVNVLLVMVQCHSGGFANLIYKDGDSAKGFTEHLRTGFFATTAPRLAAGCTPIMNEDDYEDFSTHFFAALTGTTRTGKKVPKPDYDRDGRVSCIEAFTYVLLTDNTIDIPVTTSDQLLRDKSRYRKGGDEEDVLPETAPYETVLASATPSQKAALQGLAEQLKLTEGDPLVKARELATQIEKDRQSIADQQRRNTRQINMNRQQLRRVIAQNFPELDIPNHPETPRILSTEVNALKDQLEAMSAWKNFRTALEKDADLSRQDEELENRWCRTQRLLERAKTVILAANLKAVASPETLDFYDALVQRENAPFGNWSKR